MHLQALSSLYLSNTERGLPILLPLKRLEFLRTGTLPSALREAITQRIYSLRGHVFPHQPDCVYCHCLNWVGQRVTTRGAGFPGCGGGDGK